MFARYPEKGVVFRPTDQEYLDSIFADLIALVPFQHFNSDLVRILSTRLPKKEYNTLRKDNRHLRRLRAFVAIHTWKPRI